MLLAKYVHWLDKLMYITGEQWNVNYIFAAAVFAKICF